ncbi:MAG: amidohydrolase family protein [Hyphomicrobiales bacterium]
MDLIVRNAQLPSGGSLVDIGITNGLVAAIQTNLAADAETLDVQGKLVSPGFVETHIHLDKSCILDRCSATKGDLDEAIAEVAKAKRKFTPEDVYERGRRTLEKCIANGTTHIRTQLEVDPGIGLRGLDGILPLISDYKWAVDLEICVFPQEGLTNNEGTDALMVEALRKGAKVIGAAPYTDSNPHEQIDFVFRTAREFDIDIDMHLDFGHSADNLDLDYVCEMADRYKWGGRTAIGHVTKLALANPDRFEAAANRLASAGVALTVLPSTDLFLMGRTAAQGPIRGVTHTHKLIQHGVNCSLSTNNVLNPFTPFGDCSLIRMANLNANICHIGSTKDVHECFQMITTRSARLMNIQSYGIEVGKSADFVVLDCRTPEEAVAELAPVLYAYKRGKRTVTRSPAVLHKPN